MKTVRKNQLLLLSLFALILFTQHSNSQWFQLNSGTTFDLNSVCLVTTNNVLISGRYNVGVPYTGQIIKTGNQGNNWNSVLYDTTFRPSSLCQTNTDSTAYAIGGFFASSYILYKTTNQGNTWSNITPAQPPYFPAMNRLAFLGNGIGVASGWYGAIIRTTNTGQSWYLTGTVTSYNLNDMQFINGTVGFCVGDSGTILKSVDAGQSWSIISSGTTNVLKSVKIIGADGYIVGTNGFMLKTGDYGNTWQNVTPFTTATLNCVAFSDYNNVYAVGDNGKIFISTDYGVTWNQQTSPVSTNLKNIQFYFNTTTGFICGDNGVVLKTTNGGVIGIRQISQEVPKSFSLSQNYPNPFNPTTKIDFAVPKQAMVKLSVINALGEEVEIIVDRQLNAGTYSADWNAAKFASGIYFYVLKAGDFVQSKKMILIK